ncbi:Ste3 protein [Martiniozyma asiatica (nom. inval.)]|nr:Ste3 protein [Martiniozyma asiatica]
MANLRAALSTLSAIAFIINLPPTIWHIKSRNIPAIALSIYLECMLINIFTGAIIWGGSNYAEKWKGYGWCDIMIRIEFITSVGIPSSICCILLNLMIIFLANKITIYWFTNKYLKITTEIIVSIVWPLLCSGLCYFAQSKRYVIFHITGCSAVLTNYSVAILVFFFWVFFWSFVATLLSIYTILLFYSKKKAAKNILTVTNSGLTLKKFSRLLIFCVIVTIISIVLSCLLGLELTDINKKFYDDSIHGDFWKFIMFFKHYKKADYAGWIAIVVSICNFFVFGLSEEMLEAYSSFICPIGGKKLIDWINSIFVKGGGGCYQKKFSIGQDDMVDVEQSPTDTMFTYSTFDNNKKDKTNTKQNSIISTPNQSNIDYLDDFDLYNDPLVRDQIKSVQLDDLEYLYY